MSQFLANRIVENIYVGSRYAAEDGDFLFTNQIRRVINLVANRVPNRFQMMNVKYLSFQFDPTARIFDEQDENISLMIRFIQEAMESDVQVLIHSENGDSRAIVFGAGFLVHRFHWPPERALQFIALKRPGTKPSEILVQQLKEFAARRREKYGNFKDIFGPNAPLRMNDVEILHRNTFLNATNSAPEHVCEVLQVSPVKINVKLQVGVERQMVVRWRDGLTATQPPARFASFNERNQPLNAHLTSALFRGKTMSYNGNAVTKNIPPKVDFDLVPSIGYDFDIPKIHLRLPDGHMVSETHAHIACTRPVSILKKMNINTRDAYRESIYVTIDEYEEVLLKAISKINQEKLNQVENEGNDQIFVPEPSYSQMMDENKPQSQAINKRSAQMLFKSQPSKTLQKSSLSATLPVKSTIPDIMNSMQTQVQAQKGTLSKKRPPTPPRKVDNLSISQVQTLPAVDAKSVLEAKRPTSQKVVSKQVVAVQRYQGYQAYQGMQGRKKSGEL
ncbi:Dual_specificity phosphatase [Hexamita inflata]|uniref:Dual specificity phosphatase n=1 Tax=Hexamita inflata TaxID=28002 RepID=A0AA86QTQ8_9EUKA|nr:Dual specificity phosphatase [Hexamita inflata]